MASLPAEALGFDRRVDDRTRIDRPAVLRVAAGAADVRVEDLTRDGCKIVTDANVAIGSTVTLGFAGIGQTQAKVMWSDAVAFGCIFDEALAPGAVTAATRNNVDHFAGTAATARLLTASDVKWSPRSQALVILGATGALWAAVIAGILTLS